MGRAVALLFVVGLLVGPVSANAHRIAKSSAEAKLRAAVRSRAGQRPSSITAICARPTAGAHAHSVRCKVSFVLSGEGGTPMGCSDSNVVVAFRNRATREKVVRGLHYRCEAASTPDTTLPEARQRLLR